jgi:transglutaminase-like putative cysteine protease
VLVARMHLQRSQLRWKKLGIDYPEFISFNAMQLTILSTLALIVLAWSLPLGGQSGPAQGLFDWLATPATSHSDTLVRLFHNVDSRKGAKLHSLGDILAVQSNVTLSSSPEFQVTSSQPGLIRAQSYEVYTGNGWKISGRDSEKVPAQQAAPAQAATGDKARKQESLTIKLLDSEDTLLTPGTPLGANIATTIETPRSFGGDIERMQAQGSIGAGDTYNTVGSVSVATAEQLQGAGTDYPAYVTQRYLQLPKIPQRVTDEARRVAATGGGESPYQQAKAIEQYLQTFPFDLNVAAPPAGQDMTDYFLFTAKRGYFDYQATAMAVMLRAIGIPARVAVGYVLDPSQAKGTVYTVSKDDAYSWVEVYFPQYGWVNFNPTSGKFGASGITGGTGPAGSGLIDPSLIPGGITGPNVNDVDPNPTANKALKAAPTIHGDPPWTLIWTLIAIGTLLAGAAVGLRLAWTWGMTGLSGRPRLWAQTQRVAGWAGLGSQPWETPREWSQRLGGAIAQEEDAAKFATAYEESRYGRKDLQRVDDAEVAGTYRKLRGRLLRAIPRRGRKEKPLPDDFWSKRK